MSNAGKGGGIYTDFTMKLLLLCGVVVGIFFLVKKVDIKSFLSRDVNIPENERTEEVKIVTSQRKHAEKQIREEEIEPEHQAELAGKENEEDIRQTQIRKQERYQVLVNECLKKFKKPVPDTKMTLKLKGGRIMKGIIKKITEESVEIQKGLATITFKKSQLSTETCRRCFSVDYAEYWAMKQLHKEF